MKKGVMTHSVAFVAGALIMFFVSDILNSRQGEAISAQKMKPKDRVFSNPMQKGLGPGAQMDLMMKQMDSMMDRSRSLPGKIGAMMGGDLQVEEVEEDGFYKIIITADGIDKESIAFDINGGVMRISGDIVKIQKGQWGQSRMQSSFSRAFPLPRDVDQANPTLESNEKELIISFKIKEK